MAYEFLAGAYDRLTLDIPYEEILTYYERILARYGAKPETVLDLACGTGSMSLLLARKGYRVLGVDQSEEMLTEACDKIMDLEENRPFFVCQRMQRLLLPAPVDWAVCCLDSMNYVTEPEDCRETITRVYRNLTPGGVFIFDINSEFKLQSLDGQMFIDEDDAVYCVWRTEFDPEKRLCSYGMDIFRRRGELWERTAEEHLEYAYSVEQLTEYLKAAGFTDICVFGDRTMEAPAEDALRIFFAARKEK